MLKKLIQVLGEDANKMRWLIVSYVVCSILQGIAFALLVPFLRALLNGDTATAWQWVTAELMIFIGYAIVAYRAKVSGITMGREIAGRLWQRLGDHIAKLPLGWFTGTQTGQVARLAGEGVMNVMSMSTNLLRPLMDAFVTPTVIIIFMAFFDWQLTIAVVATIPIIYLAFRFSGYISQKFDNQYHQASVNLTNRIVEFAQAQPVLRAFSQAQDNLQLLGDALLHSKKASEKTLSWGAVGGIMFSLVIQMSFTIVLLYGTSRALGKNIDAIELIALLILVTRYIQPLLDTSVLSVSMRITGNTLDRINALLNTPILVEPEISQTVEDTAIEFSNVSFGYESGKEILKDINFRVQPNTITALVGTSGSGKTTITRLIARFWDVNTGSVKIGGQDVKSLSGAHLMAQLSFVFQDVYLFSGTIEENILLGKPAASKEELNDAIIAARVDEIISRLPDGLQTQVGEGGNSLSGGERQRVSIARAILKDAPIILLDEATAALDAENEALVQEALTALSSNRTLIIVAHRLQTIMAADQILVLGNHTIEERGVHHDLLEKGGRYADFWKEKERAKGWRIVSPEKH